jgi:hypothetical protein
MVAGVVFGDIDPSPLEHAAITHALKMRLERRKIM